MKQLSTLFHAFTQAKIKKTASKALVDTCLGSMERYAKGRKVTPGWKANLSYRTYRMLVNKGVPVQQ